MVHDRFVLSYGLRCMFSVITSSALLDDIIVLCSPWLLYAITTYLFSPLATWPLISICLVILSLGDLS